MDYMSMYAFCLGNVGSTIYIPSANYNYVRKDDIGIFIEVTIPCHLL